MAYTFPQNSFVCAPSSGTHFVCFIVVTKPAHCTWLVFRWVVQSGCQLRTVLLNCCSGHPSSVRTKTFSLFGCKASSIQPCIAPLSTVTYQANWDFLTRKVIGGRFPWVVFTPVKVKPKVSLQVLGGTVLKYALQVSLESTLVTVVPQVRGGTKQN